MGDWVSDGPTPEAPESAAAGGYAGLSPTFGQAVEKTADQSTDLTRSADIERAMDPIGERQLDLLTAGFSREQTQQATSGMIRPKPIEPDDLNERFTIPGEKPLFDKAIPEQAARLIYEAKKNEIDRESALARFQNAHSWPVNLAASAAASMLDPINIGAMFVPGIGEGAILDGLATAGIRGFAGRTLARTGAGAITGAAVTAPEAFLRARSGEDFASDYDMRSAMFDTAMGAAGFAVLHAGFGAAGDMLRAKLGLVPIDHASSAEQPLPTSPGTVSHPKPNITSIEGVPPEPTPPDALARAESAPSHVAGQVDNVERETRDGSEWIKYPGEEWQYVKKTEEPFEQVPFHPDDPSHAQNWGMTRDEIAERRGLEDELDPGFYSHAIIEAEARDITEAPPQTNHAAISSAVAQIADGRPVEVGPFFDVDHASPYDFDAFDMNKVNTGEKSQSYGHGLYFSTSDDIHQHYLNQFGNMLPFKNLTNEENIEAERLFGPEMRIARNYQAAKPDNFQDVKEWLERKRERLTGQIDQENQWIRSPVEDMNHIDYGKGIYEPEAGSQMARNVIEVLEKQIALIDKMTSGKPEDFGQRLGTSYKVRIAANPEHFLDWDQSLAKQSEHVKNALLRSGLASAADLNRMILGHEMIAQRSEGLDRLAGMSEGPEKEGLRSWLADLETKIDAQSVHGKQFYESIEDKKPADDLSETLRRSGIPGIRYLDASERAGMVGSGVTTDWESKSRNYVLFDDRLARIARKNGEEIRSPAELAQWQTELHRSGFASGMPQAEFDAANEAVYGKPEEEQSKPAGEKPAQSPAKAASEKATEPTAASPKPSRELSLFEYLADAGGLKRDPEVTAILGKENPFLPGIGRLIRRKGGLPLDEALRFATDAGYLVEPGEHEAGPLQNDVNTLLDLLRKEAGGSKQYRLGHEPAPVEDIGGRLNTIESHVRGEMEKFDIDPEHVVRTYMDRTVQMLHTGEETDALVAYERAVMEHSEQDEVHQQTRHEQIGEAAGWDGRREPIEFVHPEPDAASDLGGGAARADVERTGEGGRVGEPGTTARHAGESHPEAAGPTGASEPTAAGDQRLIPGVAPVTQKAKLEAQAGKPLRGGSSPPPSGGLFDEGARQQADIFDQQIADAERQLVTAGPLHPDDLAEISRTQIAIDEAADREQAYSQAGECLSEAGI